MLKVELITDIDFGIEVISQNDEFIDNLNLLTLQWLGFATKEEYVSHLRKCIVLADNKQVIKLQKIFKEIIQKWNEIGLPDLEVNVCLTNGLDANGLPYTRGNTIFYPGNKSFDEVIFSHELFHILSRMNPEIKDIMYSHFGFEKTTFIVPSRYFIVNPDAPVNNYKIKLRKWFGLKEIECIPFISPMGSRMYFSLYDINSGEKVSVANTNFLYQIGITTQYVAHPEEICADHFKFLFYESFFTNKWQIDNFRKKLLSCFR